MLLETELKTIVNRSSELRKLFAEEALVLDVLNASEITGIAPETIYKWCREKGIAVRFGAGIFVGANRLASLLSLRKDYADAFLRLQAAIDVSLQHEQRPNRPERRTA